MVRPGSVPAWSRPMCPPDWARSEPLAEAPEQVEEPEPARALGQEKA